MLAVQPMSKKAARSNIRVFIFFEDITGTVESSAAEGLVG